MRSETQGIISNTTDLPSGGYPQGVILEDIDAVMAKQAIVDAFSYLGQTVAIRRKIRPEDGVERCSACYDEAYDQSTDENCPFCWGTTFEGGFFETQISRAIFQDITEALELTKNGWVRVQVPRVTMLPTPQVREGDLIVRLKKNGDEYAETGRYWIKDVNTIEIAPSYETVGQSFSVTKIQYGDPGWNIPI